MCEGCCPYSMYVPQLSVMLLDFEPFHGSGIESHILAPAEPHGAIKFDGMICATEWRKLTALVLHIYNTSSICTRVGPLLAAKASMGYWQKALHVDAIPTDGRPNAQWKMRLSNWLHQRFARVGQANVQNLQQMHPALRVL